MMMMMMTIIIILHDYFYLQLSPPFIWRNLRATERLQNSAPLVFQNVESFLVLRLKRHDEVLRGDFPPAVLVHLAHEDVVQAW